MKCYNLSSICDDIWNKLEAQIHFPLKGCGRGAEGLELNLIHNCSHSYQRGCQHWKVTIQLLYHDYDDPLKFGVYKGEKSRM